MKRFLQFRFLLVVLLTIITILINLSSPFPIKFSVPLPFVNSIVTVNQQFPGINLSWLPGKRNFAFHKGLDLEGGTSITLRADMKDIAESQREDALTSAKEVIERRINFYGVSEPMVQTAKVNNDYRIIVEIPGVTDVQQAVQLVGQTAKLSFWESTASTSAPLTIEDSLKIATNSSNRLPFSILQSLGKDAKQTNLTGNDLKTAATTFDSTTGKPQVALTFTAEGAKKFGEITKRNVGKVVSIALDNQVIEAPRVNEPIYGGQAVITGEFTTKQANQLQIQLNAGALPVSLSVLEQRSIGASLGQESLQKSLLAGIAGFFVIVLFMIFLYGRLGALASIALIIYTLLVLSLFRLIPVTLTLAGIAGFILSIGVAVDANILIFERMKEEFRRGRSWDQSCDIGFSRAWLSIRDSNVASLITSTILFYFGTGIVRGFALTLAIGVLVSMFSAIFVTRTLLKVFYTNK
jgi:preprotein translocase subunit SecD